MKLTKSVYCLLLTPLLSIKAQTTSAGRYNPYCGLLKNKIYCYSGARGSNNEFTPDPTMIVLDISQANGASMNDLGNSWKIITFNTAGVNLEGRVHCQYGAVGGTQLVVSGGIGSNYKIPMADQTIVYDAESNSWKKYPNYIEGTSSLNREIFWGSTAEVPSKGLAFYGGYESPNSGWTFPTKQNLTANVINGGYSRTIGYVAVSYLDITNANNPWNTPVQTNAPSFFTSFQVSFFDSSTNKIFFLGGVYTDSTVPGNIAGTKYWHRFSYALSFDTVSNSWGNQSLIGSVIPSDRAYHTVTTLPNGKPTMLLYGGEKDNTVVTDYCFTLDLNTFTWTQQNIIATYVDLLRTRHSAILANNDTVFIVLGTDSVYNTTTTPVALNVSNPSSITYIEKYTGSNVSLANEPNGTQNPAPERTNPPSGLPTGAIVGISVAASVTVCFIILAFIFYSLIKRKAKRKAREADERDNSNGENATDALAVNWEEIEKQFMEVPGIASSEYTHVSPVMNPKTKPSAMVGNAPDAVHRVIPDVQTTS